MKKQIHENTLKIFSEDGKLIDVIQDTSYVLFPDAGMVLKNKSTGKIIDSYIGIGSKDSVDNYIEVHKEN